MATIAAHDIHKSYRGNPVLRGVSLDIADGEFLSLVGPSGCGKTTLLRILAGLERQDDGAVSIGGRRVDDSPPVARDVAMVFQSYALYPHMTVAQNIAVPLVMRRMGAWERLPLVGALLPGVRGTRATIARDVARVAESLEIGHLLDRKPGQLSGGQRQRVAVARAIVRDPKAFLMDEPLSNLDAKLRVQMRAELSELHRRLGATFVYVTHDQAEAMTMSDRIAVMIGGEVLQIGTPDQIYNDPRDLRVAEFVGSPAVNVLEGVVAEQGRLRAAGVAFPVCVRAPEGTPVRLAFRPESVRLAEPGQAHVSGLVPGEVAHTENSGSTVFVHVRVRGTSARVIVSASPHGRQVGLGEKVGLRTPPERILVFGADHKRLSGQRLPGEPS